MKKSHRLTEAIRDVLSRDLLKPDQRRRLSPQSHPTTGHCYVATEALYHLYGKKHGYRPHVMRVGTNTHWWLQNAQGEVLDATYEQFPMALDYSQGHCSGFLTGDKPSKRCKEVLRRLGIKPA